MKLKIILTLLFIASCSQEIYKTNENLKEDDVITRPEDADGLDCLGGYCTAKNIECNETRCVYESNLESVY
jgi:hypothetical protein